LTNCRQLALEAAEREWIARSLRLDGIEATPPLVERLSQLVAAGIAAFCQGREAARAHRLVHRALRQLWRLANTDDPPIAVIRIAIGRLPLQAERELEDRARFHWSAVFKAEFPSEGFVAWSRRAPVAGLLEALRSFIADGGARVPGRTRPDDRRSKARFEPRILGQIRGAGDGRQDGAAAARSGRPCADAADNLVMHLAIDWAMATGLRPRPGRSDRTGFGALVHHVFGWLDIGGADQALRRYWTEVGSAVITPVEGGEEWR
jgi:hypothetical protein